MYINSEATELSFILYRKMTELTVENYMTFEYQVELLGNPGDEVDTFIGNMIYEDNVDAKVRATIWFNIELILEHNERCVEEPVTAKKLVEMLSYLQNKWQ